MKRRTFLQRVGAGLVAIAALPVFAWGGFDPSRQYGGMFQWIGIDTELQVKDVAIEDARKWLPSGTEFIVSAHPAPRYSNDPFGDVGVVSWRYPVPSEYKDLPLRAICAEGSSGHRCHTERMVA